MVNDQLKHCVGIAKAPYYSYAPYLTGVVLHAYADTFAHYGFSGTSSVLNKVKNIKILNALYRNDEHDVKALLAKHGSDGSDDRYDVTSFRRRYWREVGNTSFLGRLWRCIKRESLESVSRALGHAAALTYPDISWLSFQLTYDNGRAQVRNNPKSFMCFLKETYQLFNKHFQSDVWRDPKKSPCKWVDIKTGLWRCVACPHPSPYKSLEEWLKLAKKFGDAQQYTTQMLDKAKDLLH